MDVAAAVWTAIALVTVPGAVLGWISGLKGPWALAAALPLTFSVYGLAGWALGEASVPFTFSSTLVVWLIMVIVAAIWRLGAWSIGRGRRRAVPVDGSTDPPAAHPARTRRTWRTGTFLDPVWALPAAGVATGAWLLVSRSLEWLKTGPDGLDTVFQGWDVQWHANMVRWIAAEGVASPTRMGELRNLETGDPLYYPAAFHSAAGLLVELAGVTPIEAVNLTTIVVPSLGLPLSVALIAWKMLGNRGLTAQIAAGVAAILAVGSPVLYWIGQYVGAWPYLAAISVSGVVLALFMLVPYRPLAAPAAALSLAGLTQLHPSAATIVVLGLGLWWLLRLLIRPARPASTRRGAVTTRLRDLGLLAGSGLAGTLLLLPQLLSGTEQAEEVTAWDATEDVTRAESWVKAFTMDTRHVGDFFTDVDPTLLLWVAGFGAAALILWRRNLWAPAFYLLSVWLTAHALRPFDVPGSGVLDLIGGLHYATAHRLVMPVAMFTVAAAGVGVAVAIRLLTLAPMERFATAHAGRWRVGSALASVILAIPAGWGAAVYVAETSGRGAESAFMASYDDTRMVGPADRRAWDWLAEQPGAYDGLIAGDAAEGMGWMYAYNSLPSLYRHYEWPRVPRDSGTAAMYWYGHLLGEGVRDSEDAANRIDQAAESLGVNYFYVSPWPFWGFQTPRWEITHGLWTSDGVTPVYKDGSVVIFAVDAAFTDEELAELTAPGQSPDPLPTDDDEPAAVAGTSPPA